MNAGVTIGQKERGSSKFPGWETNRSCLFLGLFLPPSFDLAFNNSSELMWYNLEMSRFLSPNSKVLWLKKCGTNPSCLYSKLVSECRVLECDGEFPRRQEKEGHIPHEHQLKPWTSWPVREEDHLSSTGNQVRIRVGRGGSSISAHFCCRVGYDG